MKNLIVFILALNSLSVFAESSNLRKDNPGAFGECNKEVKENGVRSLPEFVRPWMQLECTNNYGSQIIVQSNNYRWHVPGGYVYVSSVPSWFDNEKTETTSYFTKVDVIDLSKSKSKKLYNSEYIKTTKIKDLFIVWVKGMRTYSLDDGPEVKERAKKMAAFDLNSEPKAKRIIFQNNTGNELFMDVLMANDVPIVAKYCVFDKCNVFVVMEYHE